MVIIVTIIVTVIVITIVIVILLFTMQTMYKDQGIISKKTLNSEMDTIELIIQ